MLAVTGPPQIVVFDDEHPASGVPAPPPPVPSAIFWGSPSSGWKIGNWFSFSDQVRDVGLTPIEPPRGDSTQARRISGSGVPGGVLWLELNHPQRWAVDLAPYAGITFWARVSSPSGELGVLLNDGLISPETWRTLPPPSSLTLVLGPEWQEVTVPFETLRTSTSGVSQETTTVSSNVPTRSSALTVATKFDDSSRPSRLNVENPGRVNVMEYAPGRSSAIW